MKQLIWKLVLPLTIISFLTVTKWWYVDIWGGTDEILTGFPLPFMCRCWHTSLCLQIFVSALIIDVLTYFSFWLTLTFLVNKFLIKIRLNKTLTIILLSLSGILLVGAIFIGSLSDNIYTWNRNFKFIKLDTGYKFIWDEKYPPDYHEYHPEMKKE
ncbi:MAG: hypothetical protein KBB11_04470 [Bacteroidales bacterium]|nr:hypothetical protein [Bacteroidales bacterium]HOY38863.1 hypothetical protein [Bacteroidales bacterium]HQP03965.1 hypothetical protein [Bacteroidales bacterium]